MVQDIIAHWSWLLLHFLHVGWRRNGRNCSRNFPKWLAVLPRTEAEIREKMAVQRVEALRIRFHIEPVNFHNVPFVFHSSITEGNLVMEGFRSDELHRLQMWMKVVDNGERYFEQVFWNEMKNAGLLTKLCALKYQPWFHGES